MAELACNLLPLAWDVSKKMYTLASACQEREFPGLPSRSRKILVAGLAGSGKTSVINALTGKATNVLF